jgi:hypothetical protein
VLRSDDTENPATQYTAATKEYPHKFVGCATRDRRRAKEDHAKKPAAAVSRQSQYAPPRASQ